MGLIKGCMDEENRMLTMAGIAMRSAGWGRTVRGAQRRRRRGRAGSEVQRKTMGYARGCEEHMRMREGTPP